MVLVVSAVRALEAYCARASDVGGHKVTIRAAVALTRWQQEQLTKYLSEFWTTMMVCPRVLDLKPAHGYRSRVTKDGFTRDQFVAWLIQGCSDEAHVGRDGNGRPHLSSEMPASVSMAAHGLLVPVRSSASGSVHVDDVIPKGIW